jgi:GNAT superfamily N-acetyltransferase
MIEPPDCRINIRSATVEDVPVLFELITALASYERLTPPEKGAIEKLKRDISGERPRFQAFLTEIEGIAVGYALAFETYGTFIAEPKYYVEDIFILPEFRGRGIGSSLFSFLAAEAVRRGCRMMEWTALDWNQSAIDFYEHIGATLMKEWRVFRLKSEALNELAGESQSYFQSESWQRCERQADEDIKTGRVNRFSCAADAADHLKNLD